MALVDINWKPSARDLRIFAALQWVFFGLIAWSAWRRHEAPMVATIIVAVSSLVAIVGLTAPRAILPVYIGWMTLVLPIGWVVSHLVLAGVYFLVFTPVAIVLRVTGRDPLERNWDPSATTYWKPRGEPPEPQRYFRES